MNLPQNILPAISPYSPVPTQRLMTPPGVPGPPVAGHSIHSSEPGQYCHPATAPPIWTMYNPNTRETPSTPSVGHSPSPYPPTTSTSTR